ncbi:hypothetical protein TKK_0016372 [Trichogramma kaykai]
MAFTWCSKLFRALKAKILRRNRPKVSQQEQRLIIRRIIQEKNKRLEKCVEEKVCILQQQIDELKVRVDKFENSEESSSALTSVVFDTSGYKTDSKAEFYANFKPLKGIKPGANDYFVIDGNNLLYKFCWDREMPVKKIIHIYVEYVRQHFTPNCLIIFDDYIDDLEHEAQFEEDSIIYASDAMFYSRAADRIRMTQLIREELHRHDFCTRFVEGEGAADIVEEACRRASPNHKTWIVGEDVDLLVVLAARARQLDNVYMLRLGHRKSFQAYDPRSFVHPESQEFLLFLHAFSGCDTTFYFNDREKNRILRKLMKSNNMTTYAEKFYDEDSSEEEIGETGIKIVQELFFKKKLSALDKWRAVQHAHRTYAQVQIWLGN